MIVKWKFLQDWDNEHETKLEARGIIAMRVQSGWLVAYNQSDEPVCWYELEDAEGLFR